MNEQEMMVKLEQIKALVERAYINPGLEFDSLRRIGALVNARVTQDA